MGFLLKIWGGIKKVPGWLWVVLLAILAIAIPAFGWARERRAHGKTKLELNAEKDRADRATEVAEAEAEARRVAEEARRKAEEERKRIKEERERVETEIDATQDRIDKHAGDVDAVADDINDELGLGGE